MCRLKPILDISYKTFLGDDQLWCRITWFPPSSSKDPGNPPIDWTLGQNIQILFWLCSCINLERFLLSQMQFGIPDLQCTLSQLLCFALSPSTALLQLSNNALLSSRCMRYWPWSTMGSLPTCTFSFSIIRGMADFCCLINWFRQVSIPAYTQTPSLPLFKADLYTFNCLETHVIFSVPSPVSPSLSIW